MEVENVFNNSSQCLNISLTGAILIFLIMADYFHFVIMNNSNILPRKQGHGDPTMHEPKSGMLDVHVVGLEFSNYNLTRNFIPKFMEIKTSNNMIYVN